jgi:hypothetical protein
VYANHFEAVLDAVAGLSPIGLPSVMPRRECSSDVIVASHGAREVCQLSQATVISDRQRRLASQV